MASPRGSEGIHLSLPADVVEQLVDRVAERVRGELASASPWLTRSEAAVYLRVPVSRLEKDRTVPAHRWEGRILYDRPRARSLAQHALTPHALTFRERSRGVGDHH
jgi:hypothetical protein